MRPACKYQLAVFVVHANHVAIRPAEAEKTVTVDPEGVARPTADRAA